MWRIFLQDILSDRQEQWITGNWEAQSENGKQEQEFVQKNCKGRDYSELLDFHVRVWLCDTFLSYLQTKDNLV